MIDTAKLSNENILFKNFTSANGEFSEYLAGRAFAELFDLGRSFAAKVVRFAVKNNHLFVDAITIQEYQMYEKNKKIDQCSMEEEQHQIDHENYMYDCGLTIDGHDWIEC